MRRRPSRRRLGWRLALASAAVLASVAVLAGSVWTASARSSATHHHSARSYAKWLIGRGSLTSAERADFDLVNADRVQAGIGLLRFSGALEAIARKRVREMMARRSDYAGYDVAIDVKRARLCTTAGREIEDQLQGGGAGSYSWIELDPHFTAFAVAISTDAAGNMYAVEDYQAPCGLAVRKPPTLPKASASLAGLVVSDGPPAPGTPLTPLSLPQTTITTQAACDPAAGLYAAVTYSGAASGYFSGFSNRGQMVIEQPAAEGINYVLLADHLTPGPIVFGLAIATKIELPDGDRVPEVIAGTGPRRFVEISAAC